MKGFTKKMFMAGIGFLLIISIVSAGNGGFNEFGYNDKAGIFVGPADGVDRMMDGAVWGDPLYAKDHLVMKWNSEWTRGKAEGWDPAKGPYAAWENNEWNGAVPGGSGEVWHYKIRWSQSCRDTNIPSDGGVEGGAYCIWGQFETVMDHGTVDGVHEFLAKSNPNGYGIIN